MNKFGNWEDLDLKGKMSGSIKTLCPECNHRRSDKKDRSVSVNIGKGHARCYYCDTYFFKDEENKEEDFVMPPQDWQNHTQLGEKHVKWWKSKRGISQRTLVDLGITEETRFVKDKNQMCVVFNYFKGDEVVNKKFRTATKDFSQEGSNKIFYNYNVITKYDEIVVVEGEIDAMSFWEVGVENVISVPNGSGDTSLFKDNQDLEGKHIIIAVDKDKKGQELEANIIEIFGKKNCSIIDFPEGCKDPNEVLVNHGAIALENCYKNREKIVVREIADKFFGRDEINGKLNDFLTGKIEIGYNIGIEAFDNHFAFKKNEYYVLTARKGIGKTTINQSFQVMASVVHGLKWVVAFAENEGWDMKLNYMSYVLGDYAKDVMRTNPDKYESASKWVDEHFFFLKPTTIVDAMDTTTVLIEELGVSVFALMLDPINSFEYGFRSIGNGYEDGKKASILLQKFCRKYCTVYINQHPIMSEQRSTGALSSYAGEGGQYLNKASFTYTLHREKGLNDNELHVDNVRTKATGGSQTDPDNPVLIKWSPTGIDVGYKDGSLMIRNAIQKLVKKHKPFLYDGMHEDLEKLADSDPVPKLDTPPTPINPEEAWSEENSFNLDDLDDVPF